MKIIKKEIFMDAPPSKVWQHITDSKKIALWLMPNDFEPTVGRAFSMDCAEEGIISCAVKEMIPQKKLVYSFTSEVIKIETTVTITLVPEGTGTRLTLTHAGWDALPPSDEGIACAFEEGWGERLNSLKEQITGTVK